MELGLTETNKYSILLIDLGVVNQLLSKYDQARDYYLKHGKSREENGEYPKGSCI